MLMNMESALNKLMASPEDPHAFVRMSGEKDWPIFGCLSEHIPVEMLWAGDIVPVRIQGGASASLTSSHLQTFSCGYAKVAMHRMMNGEYDYLQGLLAAKTCDVGLSLFQILTDLRPPEFTWLVSLPCNRDLEAEEYLVEEFSELKAALEKWRGKRITDQKLWDSISLYNALREAALQAWRKRDEGLLAVSARQIVSVLRATQVMAPGLSLDLLRHFLEREGTREGRSQDGIRLLLLGNRYGEVSLLDMIEKSGGRVVFDDTTNIGRHLGPVIPIGGDPVRALAAHYGSMVTGCYRLTFEERWEQIRSAINAWRVAGCVNVIQKYCDTSLFESSLLNESFEKMGIPYLALEIDDLSLGLSQMETRVQAFVEMVGGL